MLVSLYGLNIHLHTQAVSRKSGSLSLLKKSLIQLVACLDYQPNLQTVHPSPLSILQPRVLEYFEFSGRLVGLVMLLLLLYINVFAKAIKENVPLGVNFSKSFLKLLIGNTLLPSFHTNLYYTIGVQPALNDLEDIEPELVQSLRWMLDNDVTELDQPFIYELDVFGAHVTQKLGRI